MNKVQSMMNAPIPGESLTQEPGKYPWEHPPQFSNPIEALEHYAERIYDKKNLPKMLMALEGGVPLKSLVEASLTKGVSKGLHSMDVSLLIAPAVHEVMKVAALDAGIEFDEGLDEEDEELETMMTQRASMQEMNRDLVLPEEEPSNEGVIKRR